jgi:hypothetical protein
MIKQLITGYKRWRLRRAMENHALWKARYAELERQLKEGDASYRCNSYNRNQAIRASGLEAKYAERVEILIREA